MFKRYREISISTNDNTFELKKKKSRLTSKTSYNDAVSCGPYLPNIVGRYVVRIYTNTELGQLYVK